MKRQRDCSLEYAGTLDKAKNNKKMNLHAEL